MSTQPTSSLEESFITVHESTVSEGSEPTADHRGSNHPESIESVDLTIIPRRLVLSAHDVHAADFLPSLKTRLAGVRYPDEIESAGWSYGMDNKTLKLLMEEWTHHYDWEKELGQLNSEYEHWTCRVNGLDVHYVRHDPWAGSQEDPVTDETTENPYAGQRTVNEKGE
ncbi:epoxide hydrolase, partial [Modicella reniformis]